ncbi:MAG TPA: LuxR C-terminal-related transcriptional regulator, partial [Ktedonobacterales bacterium]|nr:LuxR C-terminal-related transcriptional regulator [Ktedonobacterales bacterium]
SLQHNLGYLALRSGEPRRALRLFRESLGLFQRAGDQRGVAECLAGLAGTFGALRQPERAARLFGAANTLSESLGAAGWAANAADEDWSLALTKRQLDGATFAAAWAAGQSLSVEQAIAEASDPSQEPGERDDNHAAEPAASALTRREREIVALIAQGLTNRQIGDRLVITEGTARLHVKHILHKLGFASRTQVASWAVAQGLASAPTAQQDAD